MEFQTVIKDLFDRNQLNDQGPPGQSYEAGEPVTLVVDEKHSVTIEQADTRVYLSSVIAQRPIRNRADVYRWLLGLNRPEVLDSGANICLDDSQGELLLTLGLELEDLDGEILERALTIFLLDLKDIPAKLRALVIGDEREPESPGTGQPQPAPPEGIPV
jgi:hypothetical protein